MTSMPNVFLSYSWNDKKVTRRVRRELAAHGFNVWMDEQEMRLGSGLDSTLRGHIENADLMLVVASQSSSKAVWVGREIAHATEHSKPIVPLFIEPLKHERFEDRLGVDATSSIRFADSLRSFMRNVLPRDVAFPQPDPAVLEAHLREIAAEEVSLQPLIESCLKGGGLHGNLTSAVLASEFHALDYALNALFELQSKELMAYHLTLAFRQTGAGFHALRRWAQISSGGGIPIASGFSSSVNPEVFDAVIELFAACSPPNNGGLYQFINNNAAQMTQAQRRAVLQLVLWPVREPSKDNDLLAWVAGNSLPEATEPLVQMWTRWIESGSFDNEGERAPGDLAYFMKQADKANTPGWDRIRESLRRHVRGLARSGQRAKVLAAVDHLQACVDAGLSVTGAIHNEVSAAIGTAEWDDWRKREPAVAADTQSYVLAFTEHATTDKDWLSALREYKAKVEAAAQR